MLVNPGGINDYEDNMELAEFVEELGRVIEKWPDNAEWTVSMVATYTGAAPEEAETWFSYALEKSLDFQTMLKSSEGQHSLDRLADALSTGARVHRIESGLIMEEINAKHEKLKKRLRELTAEKEWRRAYRNLSHFLSENCSKLPIEAQVEAIGDCIRYGTKGSEAVGELVHWLKNGVVACKSDNTQQGAEDALDFIEAYGDYFIANGNRQIIETLIGNLEELITKFDLSGHVREVKDELGI